MYCCKPGLAPRSVESSGLSRGYHNLVNWSWNFLDVCYCVSALWRLSSFYVSAFLFVVFWWIKARGVVIDFWALAGRWKGQGGHCDSKEATRARVRSMLGDVAASDMVSIALCASFLGHLPEIFEEVAELSSPSRRLRLYFPVRCINLSYFLNIILQRRNEFSRHFSFFNNTCFCIESARASDFPACCKAASMERVLWRSSQSGVACVVVELLSKFCDFL